VKLSDGQPLPQILVSAWAVRPDLSRGAVRKAHAPSARNLSAGRSARSKAVPAAGLPCVWEKCGGRLRDEYSRPAAW